MNSTEKQNWFILTAQEWLKSLKTFLPPEIKLFSLLTVNSFVRAWHVILRKFWWLLLAIPVIIYAQSFAPAYSFYANLGLQAIQTLFIFILYLAIRPSVQSKDYEYFLSYAKHCFVFGLYFLVFMMLASGIFSLAMVIAFSINLSGLLALLIHLASPLAMILFIFSLFFFLDAELTFKNLNLSFWRGAKMVWYGLPFVGINLWLFDLVERTVKHLIYGILYLKAPMFSVVLVYASYLVLFSFLLCVFNVFYNKRIAEKFVRYF